MQKKDMNGRKYRRSNVITQSFISEPTGTDKLQLRQHAQEIAEDTIQNMGIHGSITGKTMTRIICVDHITTATTPPPNL